MSFGAFPSVFQATYGPSVITRNEIVHTGGDIARSCGHKGFWDLLTPKLVIDDPSVNFGQFPRLSLESPQTLQG